MSENEIKDAIVAALEQGNTLTKAAQSVGKSVTTVWRWRKKDPEFAERVEAAIESRIQIVADALYVKAVNGNVTAAIFYLCNRDPERWKHVSHIRHAIRADAPLKIHLTWSEEENADNR